MRFTIDEMSTYQNYLDPKWLLLMDALHRTGSVTRAAEQLGQSQPTVSIWLSQMRRELNDPLFVRTSQGMQPTPRAQAMMVTVKEVLDGMRRLSSTEPVFDPSREKRDFRILMTDASHVTLLPHLFSHVRAVAPNVKLEAATISPSMAQALESGDADLALGLIPSLESGFYQQSLFVQDWICLAHARHPRLQGKLSKAAYQKELHVGIVAGTGQSLLDKAVSENDIHRKIALELPGFLGLSAILTTTDLVATLPRHIGETLARSASLQVLKCPFQIPSFVVKQHWHARFHYDQGNRWLRGVCATLFTDRSRIRGGSATDRNHLAIHENDPFQ